MGNKRKHIWKTISKFEKSNNWWETAKLGEQKTQVGTNHKIKTK
jgi:hypothetical protein